MRKENNMIVERVESIASQIVKDMIFSVQRPDLCVWRNYLIILLTVSVCSVNDTLDDIFEDSGDEEESQDIVNQVLDEIGIEISGKVRCCGRKKNPCQ